MKLISRTFASAALGVFAGASVSYGQLVDSFDPPNANVTATQAGSAPGPTVLSGGPTGDFLRLTDTVNGQSNRYSYDRTDVGGFDTINASWDYRASTGTTADGASFQFLPTADWGTSGDAAVPGVSEEPNIARTFAVGVDLHPAGSVNDVSFHWDGIEFSNARPANGTIDFNSGQFHNFDLNLQRVGNSTNATLTLTPDVHGAPGTPVTIMSQALPFVPYENRIQLTGRTGGLNVAQDYDNINVTSSNAFAGGLPSVNPNTTFQDFDSTGATSYTTQIHSFSDTVNNRPGPLVQAADGGSDGAFLRLVHDGVNSNRNSFSLDRGVDGGITNKSQTVQFDMRSNSANGNPADGFGVYLLPTAAFGDRGNTVNINTPESAGQAGALHIGFDTHPNNNTLHITADGNPVASVLVPDATVNFDSNQFNRFFVNVTPTATGVDVTVDTITDINGTPGPQTQIASASIPGGVNFDYRVAFSGRTGGADADVDLDNIVTSTNSTGTTATTMQDFESNGGVGQSGYKAYRLGAGLVPALVDDGGNTVLRLVHDGQNGQQNTVAFDQAADGIVTTQSAITADFSFRATDGAMPSAAADGFSLRLLPTAMFGTENLGTNGQGAEEPNIAGVLAFGFDLHPADTVNDVSIHFGNEKSNITLDPNTQVDLDDGAFHNVSIFIENSGTGVNIDYMIDAVQVWDDFFVDGYNVDDFRAEFAARSGGRNYQLDLDNIAIAAIPEPTGAMLLGVGAWLLALRRRRS